MSVCIGELKRGEMLDGAMHSHTAQSKHVSTCFILTNIICVCFGMHDLWKAAYIQEMRSFSPEQDTYHYQEPCKESKSTRAMQTKRTDRPAKRGSGRQAWQSITPEHSAFEIVMRLQDCRMAQLDT